MKTGHGCEEVSKCECGYIEDERFEVVEGWEEIRLDTRQVIALASG